MFTATITTITNNGIELTAKAIATAQRNATKMFDQGYKFEEDETFTGSGFVFTPEGKKYLVHTPDVAPYTCKEAGKCTCPYFEQNGVCKHCYFAEWTLQDAALVEQAEQYEDYLDDRVYIVSEKVLR